MQIGELCTKTGMSKDTIRFYEKIGLLTKIERRTNGYKNYSNTHVEQLKLLKHAKELGFTLNEIKELAQLLFSSKLSLLQMTEFLKTKEAEIDIKINKLQAFKKEIRNTLAGHCEYKEQLKQVSK